MAEIEDLVIVETVRRKLGAADCSDAEEMADVVDEACAALDTLADAMRTDMAARAEAAAAGPLVAP